MWCGPIDLNGQVRLVGSKIAAQLPVYPHHSHQCERALRWVSITNNPSRGFTLSSTAVQCDTLTP